MTRRPSAPPCAALIALLSFAPAVRADEEAKLTASDAAASDQFGYDVAVSGSVAIVGSREDDSPAFDRGSAYVFARTGTTWSEVDKLLAGDGQNGDKFGNAVALDGATAVVGAFLNDEAGFHAGAAYVFVDSGGWTEEAKLIPLDAAAIDQIGWDVGVFGDRAILGAFANDDAGSDSGSAYVFARTGTAWGQEQKLTASNAGGNDHFGWAVDITGGRALVGAPFEDTKGANAGAAYVFVRSGTTWSEETTLLGSDSVLLDEFGSAVALDPTTAVVGAPNESNAFGSEAGSAYVFERSGTTWTQTAKLLAPDGAPNHHFGYSVSIDVDRIIVGAPDAAGLVAGSGAAYTYVRNGTSWVFDEKVTASDGAAGDGLGMSVANAGNLAVAGAIGDDDAGGGSGAGYAFDLGAGPFTYCTGKLNSKGCVPAVSFTGSPSITPSPFAIDSALVVNSAIGILFYGITGPIAVPFQGGTLCVAPPIRRSPTIFSGGTAGPQVDCTGVFSFDYGALIDSGLDPFLVAGAGINAQFWYRDVPATFGIGLSNAIQFVIGP